MNGKQLAKPGIPALLDTGTDMFPIHIAKLIGVGTTLLEIPFAESVVAERFRIH